MENKEKKVEMIAHDMSKETAVQAPHDDRLDIIEIVYGEKPSDYTTEKCTKQEGFDRLYEYYADSDNPMIPRNYPADRKLRAKSGMKVNNDTIYVKMRYKDGMKQMVTVVKDLPLWIAVERAVSHKHHVELITKAEHDAFYQQRDYDQNAWRRQVKAENERLREMTGLEPQPQVNNLIVK